MQSSSKDLVRAALIIVDLQNDFCPPTGSLAVSGGRDIAEPINKLLELPFRLKVATQDWHPKDHISFASNHEAPNNAVGSIITVANPENPSEDEQIMLFNKHCVQDSFGAQLISELNVSRIDSFVRKGTDKRVEMFSGFKANYKNPSVAQSSLLRLLKEAAVDQVFVVGLAANYCVKCTAVHSAENNFETTVLSDATRAIDQSEQAQEALKHDLAEHGVGYKTIAEAGLWN